MEFDIGNKVKEYIATQNREAQLNRITTETLERAANEMMKYFEAEKIDFCIDNIGQNEPVKCLKDRRQSIEKKGYIIWLVYFE